MKKELEQLSRQFKKSKTFYINENIQLIYHDNKVDAK